MATQLNMDFAGPVLKGQTGMVYDHIRNHGSITGLEAQELYGIMRLASRINDLKKMGVMVHSEMVMVTNRYGDSCRIARYTIEEAE